MTLRDIVLAELAKGTHTEGFADGARWAVQQAERLASEPTPHAGWGARVCITPGCPDHDAVSDPEPACNCGYGGLSGMTKHAHSCSWGQWNLAREVRQGMQP